MRLQLDKIFIDRVRFANETQINKGLLRIDREELQGILREDGRLGHVEIELACPGESCRILQVVDVIEPRAKTGDSEGDFPGALGKQGTVGKGKTIVLSGAAVLLSEQREEAKGTKAAHGEFIDMTGDAADISAYGKTCNIVLLPQPAEGVGPTEYKIALKIAGLKAAVYLARAGRDLSPDATEVYELPPLTGVTKGLDGLPKVAYIYQVLTTQLGSIPGHPILYGIAIDGMLPTIIHPNEVLDGAIVTPYRSQAMDTYDIQNHAVIRELYRRHGKDLCFVGVIMTIAGNNQPENDRTAIMAARMAKWSLGAEGVVLTKSGGGAPEVPMAQTARRCEELGMKVAVAMAHYAADESDSSFDGGIIFNVPEVNAIVSMGTPWATVTVPRVDRLIGHAAPGSEDDRVTGEMRTQVRWIRGATTQLGSSRLIAVRY